jgi:hypothetical protein
MSDPTELDPARIGCITASRMSDVLAGGKGITRAKYAAELAAARLTGLAHRNTFTTSEMEHGNEFEPMARMQYELRNGVMVEGTGKTFLPHPFIKNCGCTPDGLVNEDGMTQFKCPSTHVFINYKLVGEVPKIYVPQMTLELACSRRNWNDFVAFEPNLGQDGYFQIRFTPTAQEIADLEKEVRMFDSEVNLLVEKIISLRKEKA